MKISIDQWRKLASIKEKKSERAPYTSNIFFGREFVKSIELLMFSEEFRNIYTNADELNMLYKGFKEKDTDMIKEKKSELFDIDDSLFLILWLFINNGKRLTRIKKQNYQVINNEQEIPPYDPQYVNYNKYKLYKERDSEKVKTNNKNRKGIFNMFLMEIDDINAGLMQITENKLLIFTDMEGYSVTNIDSNVLNDLEKLEKRISKGVKDQLKLMVQQAFYPSVDMDDLIKRGEAIVKKMNDKIGDNKFSILEISGGFNITSLREVEDKNEQYQFLDFVNRLEKMCK